MTEKELDKIFQQVFNGESGKVILENLQRVILEHTPFSNRAEDTTTDSLLRDGARELYNYILSRVRGETTDD
jgi:hypothetical protein